MEDVLDNIVPDTVRAKDTRKDPQQEALAW